VTVQAVDVAVALLILLGLVGVVLPVLPGLLLIAVAIIGWAAYVGGGLAWAMTALALLVLAAGALVKYVVAGRHLRTKGVPNRTLVAGGLLGIIGFFVVPVIGLVVGFVLGIYLAELQRLGRREAWPATRHALTAVGLAVLIELMAGFVAAGLWLVAVVNT
jgi:uncharacterized protein